MEAPLPACGRGAFLCIFGEHGSPPERPPNDEEMNKIAFPAGFSGKAAAFLTGSADKTGAAAALRELFKERQK